MLFVQTVTTIAHVLARQLGKLPIWYTHKQTPTQDGYAANLFSDAKSSTDD